MSVFRPAIESLFGASRPAKIAGLVIASVINSVYCEPFGPRADILENPISECGIVIDPVLMHRNPAATVARIAFFVRVEAPSLDASPELIKHFALRNTPRAAMLFVFDSLCSANIPHIATTAFGVTGAKAVRYNEQFPTAVTKTYALSVSAFSFGRQSNDGKATKPLAREIQSPRFVLVCTEATTTLDVAISKKVCPNDFTAPAITSANTIRKAKIASAFPRKTDDCEAAELLTSEIQYRHELNYNTTRYYKASEKKS